MPCGLATSAIGDNDVLEQWLLSCLCSFIVTKANFALLMFAVTRNSAFGGGFVKKCYDNYAEDLSSFFSFSSTAARGQEILAVTVDYIFIVRS